MMQETLVLIAKDTNVEHTNLYIVEIERLVGNCKVYLTLNEDIFLEAVRNPGTKLKQDNAVLLGLQNRDTQQNTGQQAEEPQYGSLNGGVKREGV